MRSGEWYDTPLWWQSYPKSLPGLAENSQSRQTFGVALPHPSACRKLWRDARHIAAEELRRVKGASRCAHRSRCISFAIAETFVHITWRQRCTKWICVSVPCMYEIRYEPPMRQIARYGAWLKQQEYVKRCRAACESLGFKPVFVLTTALGLLGIDVPDSCMVSDERIHIGMVNRGKRRVFPQGIECHTWSQLGRRDITITVNGFTCTCPAATFAHLARYCDLRGCIVLADRMACRDKLLRCSSIGEMAKYVWGCRNLYGGATCRRALSLARENTDSRYESELRIRLIEEGLPEPEVNYRVVLDNRTERWIDLAYPELRIGIEFNGRHHLDQYVRDSERLNELASESWTIFHVWKSTLDDPESMKAFVDELKKAISRAGAGDMLRQPTDLWHLGGRDVRLDCE